MALLLLNIQEIITLKRDLVMPRFALWICLLLLCGCAIIPNTHPHTAIPLKHEEMRYSLGFSTSSNPYRLHDYTPALADSIIKNGLKDDYNQHIPPEHWLGFGLGLCCGYSSSCLYWWQIRWPGGWGALFDHRDKLEARLLYQGLPAKISGSGS